jgi:hypothetical protein
MSNVLDAGIYELNIVVNYNHAVSEFTFSGTQIYFFYYYFCFVADLMYKDNTETVTVIVYPRVSLFVAAAWIYLDESANMLRFYVFNNANNSRNYEAFGAILAVISYYDVSGKQINNTIPYQSSVLINSSLPEVFSIIFYF